MNVEDYTSDALDFIGQYHKLLEPYLIPNRKVYDQSRTYKENSKKCKSCKYCKKKTFSAYCTDKSRTIDLLDIACSNYMKRK